MLAVRIAHSDPTRVIERQTHFEEHKRYLREAPLRILLSGPFVSGDQGTTGALIVAEVESLAELEAFNAADPFVKHGVYQAVQILKWNLSLSRLREIVLPA
jgi:uncharacterized protein YciI